MQLHEIAPLNEMEAQFKRIYVEIAEQLQFDPLTANFQAYFSLRNAMLPGLDLIMAPLREIWHRMPAYSPDSFSTGDHRDIRYALSLCFARYIPLPKHASESYEIILCVNGESRHYIGQETIDLNTGDVLLLAPGAVHATGAFTDDCIRRNILLRRQRTKEHFSTLFAGDGKLAQFLRHTAEGAGGNSWCLYHVGSSLRYNQWMQALHSEERPDDPRSSAIEVGLLMAFLADLDQVYGETAQLCCFEFGSTTDEIMDCLRREFATIDRRALAARFGYSERQILRIVQQRTNMSFKAYLTKLRLDYVADMLVSTKYPILQILDSAGYENSRAFYDQFRQRFAMTPKDFRTKYL